MTIAEVSRLTGLKADTLRFYERIGLIPPVARTGGGIRNYSEHDCAWISFIKCMRGAGLSLEALREYVALCQRGDETVAQRKALLIEQREQLAATIAQQQSVLERLDRKIAGYDEAVYPCEQKLTRAERGQKNETK